MKEKPHGQPDNNQENIQPVDNKEQTRRRIETEMTTALATETATNLIHKEKGSDKNCIATPTNATSVTNLLAKTGAATASPAKDGNIPETGVPQEHANANSPQIPASPNKRVKQSAQASSQKKADNKDLAAVSAKASDDKVFDDP